MVSFVVRCLALVEEVGVVYGVEGFGVNNLILAEEVGVVFGVERLALAKGN